ncbi:MAG: hypothetical protein M3Y56_08820 [Armatimonadota bacterium]|nr:hypothetical protein [Armatimonadota bacterium]
MSEEGIDAGGDAASQSQSSTSNAGGFTASGQPADGLVRLWMKAGGWFVMSMGITTILLALRGAYEGGIPFLLLAAVVMMGASYVLAGQGMTEGYVWPLPLGLLACIISPIGFMADLIFLVAAVCFYKLIRQYAPADALNRNVPPTASLAFGLWIGGVMLFALVLIFSLGGR